MVAPKKTFIIGISVVQLSMIYLVTWNLARRPFCIKMHKQTDHCAFSNATKVTNVFLPQ